MARRDFDETEDAVAPWLSAAEVEPDARHTDVSRSRLVWWIALLALLLVLAVGLIYASLAKPDDDGEFVGPDGLPGLIQAPDTPYRVRPNATGGMNVEGVGQTAYEAADGVDPGGDLDLGALPEEPMERPVAAAPAPPVVPPVPQTPSTAAGTARTPTALPSNTATLPAPPTKPTETLTTKVIAAKLPPVAVKTDRLAGLDKKIDAASKPKAVAPPSATASGTILQLGAFSSEAKAKAAWKNFTGRYGYLSGLEPAIAPLERDGKTLYRLRATGATTSGQATDLCARLRVAGEQCSVTE